MCTFIVHFSPPYLSLNVVSFPCLIPFYHSLFFTIIRQCCSNHKLHNLIQIHTAGTSNYFFLPWSCFIYSGFHLSLQTNYMHHEAFTMNPCYSLFLSSYQTSTQQMCRRHFMPPNETSAFSNFMATMTYPM